MDRKVRKARKVGYILDNVFSHHDTGAGHPEAKDRLEAIAKGLETYVYRHELQRCTPRNVTDEEILLVHTERHLARIAATQGKPPMYLDADTITSPRSYEVARMAAGSVLALIDAIEAKRVDCGFGFVRPPGHHAEPDRAMGFCLFNNVAIGAAYALKKFSLRRILVIDFDVHHGNGTQVAFYDRPEVLYISTHQYPLYPGTGNFAEAGAGQGRGFNLNFPLPAGAGDQDYNQIFSALIYPIAEQYNPDFVLVSAGFDAYDGDPLAGMRVTKTGFQGIADTILEIADQCCRGKALFVLEGGYHRAGLSESSVGVLDQMVGIDSKHFSWEGTALFDVIRKRAETYFSEYWTL